MYMYSLQGVRVECPKAAQDTLKNNGTPCRNMLPGSIHAQITTKDILEDTLYTVCPILANTIGRAVCFLVILS